MEPLDPGASSPTKKGRVRRPLATFGLVVLPVAGSVFVAPMIANAVGPAEQAIEPAAAASAVSGAGQSPSDETLVQAFIDAGYTFDDAVVLSESWGIGDVFQTKVKAGSFLVDGVTLADSPFADPSADDGYSSDELSIFFRSSGYTYEDAETLAWSWGVGIDEAKAKAGSELKTVGVLPFVDPAPVDVSPVDRDRMDAFFAAGFDYDDAVVLAEHWGLGSPADAKLKAGSLLLADELLPELPGVDNAF